jgi:hypothetical protein
MVRESNLCVCGVVESFLKDSKNIMEAELYGSEWCWIGKIEKAVEEVGLGLLSERYLDRGLRWRAVIAIFCGWR